MKQNNMNERDKFPRTFKATRVNMIEHLIECQIGLIDKTIEDTVENENWINDWTMSQRQKDDFEKYSIPIIKKVFRCNTFKATKTYDWFIENFGLNIAR